MEIARKSLKLFPPDLLKGSQEKYFSVLASGHNLHKISEKSLIFMANYPPRPTPEVDDKGVFGLDHMLNFT
jgi:hypothetical protein